MAKKESEKYRFNFGGKNTMKITVVKTGETKGNVAKWFSVGKGKVEPVEGNVTTFYYDGSKGSMPTKIFEKNFTMVTEDE